MANIFFKLMPQVFYRIQVGGFRRGLLPVDAVVSHPLLCIPRRMLQVIVLHKLVTTGIDILDKW